MSQDWDGSSDEDRPVPGPSTPPGEPVESPETRSRFWCPGCDEEVQVSPETIGQLVRCPYCNTDFFASDEHSHLPVVDDTPDHPIDRENELDTRRVRRVSAARMTIVRSASWYLIGMILSVSSVIAFTGRAVTIAVEAHRWGFWSTVCAAIGSFFVWFGRRCLAALRAARIEMANHPLPEPDTPPDFTTLSNGRDRWKELEHIR